MDAGGGEHADEARAVLDPDHRLVVAQEHGECVLERRVQVDRGAEVAGGHAVQRFEVGRVEPGHGQAAQTGEDRFKDYKDFANQDAEFHRLIAEHSGNALLADAIGRLRSHMHQYRIYFKHGVVDETSGEHEAVLEALRSGKPASAEKAMLDHITKSYARISASLEEAEKAG